MNLAREICRVLPGRALAESSCVTRGGWKSDVAILAHIHANPGSRMCGVSWIAAELGDLRSVLRASKGNGVLSIGHD